MTTAAATGTLSGAIREADNLDVDEATDFVLSRFRTRAALAAAVRAIVRDEIRRRRRMRVSRIELTLTHKTTSQGQDRHDAHEPLALAGHFDPRWMAERVALPDGRFVVVGQMTAEDHDARSQMLSQQAAATAATAALHRDAAVTIRAAGASCLADLEADAA